MDTREMVAMTIKQLKRQWEKDKRPFTSTCFSSYDLRIKFDPTFLIGHPLDGCNSTIEVQNGTDEKGRYLVCNISTVVDSKNGIRESVEIKYRSRFLKWTPLYRRFLRLVRSIEAHKEASHADHQRERFVKRLNKLFPSSVDRLLLGDDYDGSS